MVPGRPSRSGRTSGCSRRGPSSIDPVAEKLLTEHGWTGPDPPSYPTGGDWVEQYLAPLAAVLADQPDVDIRFDHRVVGVARTGRDRLVAIDRGDVPFTRPRPVVRMDDSR